MVAKYVNVFKSLNIILIKNIIYVQVKVGGQLLPMFLVVSMQMYYM